MERFTFRQTSVRLALDVGPHTVTDGVRTYESDTSYVQGLRIGDMPPMQAPRYVPPGKIREQEITLPRAMARRLGSFFMECYVDAAAKQSKNWDCHIFATYMLGAIAQVPLQNGARPNSPLAITEQPPTTPEDIKPYTCYNLVAWSGDAGKGIHSVVALPDGQCLSVHGIQQPLAIARNEILMAEYGAQTMHRLIPADRL